MDILIISCDKNEDIWQPFNTLYKKYWKHDYKTFIVTETKDCEYFETIKTQRVLDFKSKTGTRTIR